MQIGTFGFAALAWLALGVGLIQLFEHPSQTRTSQVECGILWFLSILDLFVLTFFISQVLQQGSASKAQKEDFSFRIWFWGLFKVVCMGLFIIDLLKGQKITLLGLLMGIGTLWAVPLIGGFLWSWTELKRK